MNTLRLDHLVYAVPELGAGIEDLEKRLGVRASPGGKHVGLGTHNALLSLGDDQYLEVIAPDPDQPLPDRARPFGLDEYDGSRLAGWAAKESKLEARVAAAREAGYDAGVVLDLGRDTPQGERIEWRLTVSQTPGGDGLVPFLIDWGATAHPAAGSPTGCRLVAVRAEHPDPEPVRAQLAAIGSDLEITQAPQPAIVATLDTPRGRVELR